MINRLLFASLILLCFKLVLNISLTHLFVTRIEWTSLTLQWIMLVLVFVQIAMMYWKKMSYLWIASALQCSLIFFTSEGTFGWFFSYMLKPFELYRPYPVYFSSLSLILAELAKTLWFYTQRTKNHQPPSL
jgi:hypothetical protein